MLVLLLMLSALPYILCAVAISRKLADTRAFVLIVRSTIFLGTIKALAIVLVAFLARRGADAGIVASWYFAVLLFPENFVGPTSTTASLLAVVETILVAVLFSFLWSVLMVGAISAFRRLKGHATLVLLATLSLAIAKSGQAADSLPAKTIKIVPTEDIVVLGWVNPNTIVVPTGENPALFAALNDPTGAACELLLAAWQSGFATGILTDADRQYANAFLLQHSGNTFPPSHIDPDGVQAGGDYRLFNRFQTTYRVKDGKVISVPRFIKAVAAVGSTPNPCNPLAPAPAGDIETHANGARGTTVSQTGVAQVNEGRIGSLGQDVNQTLNGHTTPWIWSVIKFDDTGALVYPFSLGPTNNHQIFPTYFVYRNGQEDISLRFQQSHQETFIGFDETSHITGDVP